MRPTLGSALPGLKTTPPSLTALSISFVRASISSLCGQENASGSRPHTWVSRAEQTPAEFARSVSQ
jgi:hypothetical protein